jgi:N-acyl-D-amino-acid deacylase
MRGEGDHLLEAADELIAIARDAGVPAEIYHIKAAGAENWGKFDALLAKVDSARRAGLRISANMYTYPASSTVLTSRFPTWAEAGGFDSLLARLGDPAARARIEAESDSTTPPGCCWWAARPRCVRWWARRWRTCRESAAYRQRPRRGLMLKDRSRVAWCSSA